MIDDINIHIKFPNFLTYVYVLQTGLQIITEQNYGNKIKPLVHMVFYMLIHHLICFTLSCQQHMHIQQSQLSLF